MDLSANWIVVAIAILVFAAPVVALSLAFRLKRRGLKLNQIRDEFAEIKQVKQALEERFSDVIDIENETSKAKSEKEKIERPKLSQQFVRSGRRATSRRDCDTILFERYPAQLCSLILPSNGIFGLRPAVAGHGDAHEQTSEGPVTLTQTDQVLSEGIRLRWAGRFRSLCT